MTVRSVLPALLVVCGLLSFGKRGEYPEPQKSQLAPVAFVQADVSQMPQPVTWVLGLLP